MRTGEERAELKKGMEFWVEATARSGSRESSEVMLKLLRSKAQAVILVQSGLHVGAADVAPHLPPLADEGFTVLAAQATLRRQRR